MSKILILGISPLPFEKKNILNAPGIRTWQFTKSLLKDKHQICLVCSQAPGAYGKKKLNQTQKKTMNKKLIYHSLTQENFLDLRNLQKIHDKFCPDCIVSASSFLPSYLAIQIRTDAPIWIDQSGDLMAEAQMKAFVEKDNSYIYNFWKIEREVLEKGDIFSSISYLQRYAIIGKLGTKGRLNKETVGYEFVHVIPNAIDEDKYQLSKNIIRGKFVKKDDFVILWSGGYNTWTNIEILFSALEKAMAKNKKIKFVSTGGAIPNHNEITYQNFLKLINNSRFKTRFIMLGWVPYKDLVNIYLESNLGINIDRSCYEAILGSRNRILDWMKVGLPVLTTKFCELTQILEEKRVGFIFPPEDANILSNSILNLSSKKGLLVEYSQRAKEFVQKEFSYEKTTKPLRKWAEKPRHAPDRINKSEREKYLDNIKGYSRCIEDEYLDNLKSRYENLKQHSDGMNKELDNRAKAISARDDKLHQLELKLNNLKNHCENLNQHSKNLEKDRDSLRQHSKNLEKDRKNLRQHSEGMNKELDNRAKAISARDDKLHQLELELNNLKNHCENLKQHSKNLENDRDGLRQHSEGMNKELDNRAKAISARDDKLHQLGLEVNNLRKERDYIKIRAEEKEQQISDLGIQIRDLTNQLNILISQVDNLQSKLNQIYATRAYKFYKLVKKLTNIV